MANIMLPSVAELAAVLAANSSDAVTIYAAVATWIRNQDGNLFYQASSKFFSVCLRTALGLLHQSTHVQIVEVIARAEPLRLGYSMLNQRYQAEVFSSVSHPLKQNKNANSHSLGSPKIPKELTIVSALETMGVKCKFITIH
jgi:hypothetical protein